MTSTSSPTPPKPLLVFTAHALVVALLIGYWPSARAVYPSVFRAGVEAVFAAGDAPGMAVRPGQVRGDGVVDTFLEGLDPDQPEARWRVSFSTLRMGYWPFAVLAALLFATPMAGRRRTWALLVGFVWIGAYAALRLCVEVFRAEAELVRGGAAAEAEGPVLLLRSTTEVLNSNIVVIAVILLAWVLLANPQRVLRMGGLARLLGMRRRAS